MKIISKSLFIAVIAMLSFSLASCEKNLLEDAPAPVLGAKGELKSTQNNDDGLLQTRATIPLHSGILSYPKMGNEEILSGYNTYTVKAIGCRQPALYFYLRNRGEKSITVERYFVFVNGDVSYIDSKVAPAHQTENQNITFHPKKLCAELDYVLFKIRHNTSNSSSVRWSVNFVD